MSGPRARLGAFAAGLVLVFAAGVGLGRLVGPADDAVPARGPVPTDHHGEHGVGAP